MTEPRPAIDRRTLPHTYGPWFERFAAFTEVQLRSIPVILAGNDVLIGSPTASGKTEAFAAPAAEIALAHGAAPGAVFVVCPTRALANDLARRLAAPMSLIGLSFGRYTGEHKERVNGSLPSVVVTTPEALDSLLARRPEAFGVTRMVVLDEVHFLDGTSRGDHLRVLLHRLTRLRGQRVQRVAASATVDRPADLAQRYLQSPVVITVAGVRRMRVRAFGGRDPVSLARHVEDLAGHGLRKILVFCRSRNAVEACAVALRKRTTFEERVFAHHGSMSQVHRERTERLFQHAPAAVCVATTTLEMGIDIGTVDYVLMAALPNDVASLLQRVGRGSRRHGSVRVGYASNDAGERHIFETLFGLGRDGRLCAGPYAFRPEVIAQQALVLAGERGWIDAPVLADTLPDDLRHEFDFATCDSLLEALVNAEQLERSRGGRFVLAERTERLYASGLLHSNIADAPGTTVVDRITGDTLGTVEPPSESRVTIGGTERHIVRSVDDRLLTDAGLADKPARFRPRGTPSVQFVLARALVQALGVPEDCLLLRPATTGWRLIHGLGTVGALVLAHLLGKPRESVTPYTVHSETSFERLPAPRPAPASFVAASLPILERIVGLGPRTKHVPQALREQTARRLSDIDAILEFLDRATIIVDESVHPTIDEIARFL
ncbi:MAG: DEAD/DEAH box helicase [Planctomycetota bacterium]